jgi:midasin (ATPase involved in ribosome maturation)
MEMLFDLVNLWGHMVQLLNAESLDPSYYGVFKNILNDWLVQSHGTNLASFTHAIRLELESLSKSVALSTGLSMPIIWELARPALPSTIEQWTAYDHLVSISKMLDNNAPVAYGKNFLLAY